MKHTGRVLCAMMAGLLCLGGQTASLSREVPPQVTDIREAASFFDNLARNSANPVIATLAQETLRRLQAGEIGSGNRRTTEVTLVPQGDDTYAAPTMLNKKYMATFLIDTGASYTVITPQTAGDLGIRITRDTPTVPVTTANGVTEAPVVTIKSVSLGGFTVNDVEAVVVDLGDAPQLSGLLGMSFFRGMEISFRRDKLIISR